MSEIFSVDKLKEMATTILPVPGFNNGDEKINFRVQKPRLMAMAAQGKVPNYLLGVVNDIMYGPNNEKGKKKENPDPSEIIKTYELYCRACMVEPSYEEVADFITDEQMATVFHFGIGQVSSLNSFRKKEKDDTSNTSSKALQK